MKKRSKKVLALIPLNLDGFLFSADYQSGKKAEIKSHVAANFVGWEKDHALFDRELGKVIRALKTDDAGRGQASGTDGRLGRVAKFNARAQASGWKRRWFSRR